MKSIFIMANVYPIARKVLWKKKVSLIDVLHYSHTLQVYNSFLQIYKLFLLNYLQMLLTAEGAFLSAIRPVVWVVKTIRSAITVKKTFSLHLLVNAFCNALMDFMVTSRPANVKSTFIHTVSFKLVTVDSMIFA